MSSYKLLQIHQDKVTEHLIGDVATIGTDPSSEIRIDDPGIAERHCQVQTRPNGLFVRDLRSPTGITVGGTRVYEALLQTGDEFSAGSFSFLVQYQGDKSVPLPPELQSKNPTLQTQLARVPAFAQTQFPVLILGPSGTGKELLSRQIHKYSTRSRGPFVSVNCGALSPTLIESELFGHIKGSFTGASNDRKGAFESARQGTLFLDEIGDLPLDLQAKLLRALENQEIRPVGSDRTISTDVRIVAATHQNLGRRVAQKTFREDLYFRLNVIRIHSPPLLQRMEDFESLLYSFAKGYKVRFSFGAIQRLKAHNWPGNIRELKNLVARTSATHPGVHVLEEHVDALIDHLPVEQIFPTQSHVNGQQPILPMLKDIERDVIRQRLVQNKGNQRKTAYELGMPKSTLHDRIRAYKIDIDTLLTGGEDNSVMG